mgnify:CR=1 FL=1|jgi:hypothetical protein
MGICCCKIKDSDNFSKDFNKIQPLDVLLFRNTGFISHSVRALQKIKFGDGGQDWSHVGIVINTDIMDIKNGNPGELYIWAFNS